MSKNLQCALPKNIGKMHFIGIGGIGMSGIASTLANLGYQIQGSDISESYNTERLKKEGVEIMIGHKADNVTNAAFIIKSTAVKDDNPEIIQAKKLGIPIIKRSAMLAELMRLKLCVSIAGTHGKTTTTSIFAKVFEQAGKKPTVINGGIINAHGTNAYLGEGDYLIAEADESDGTFIQIPSYIGIITNIDPEHLDYYGTFDNAKAAFKTFIQNLPFYGFAILCNDHPIVRDLATQILDRKVLTYAINNSADLKAINIRQNEFSSEFDVEVSSKIRGGKRTIKNFKLSTPGVHNVQNCLSAILCALELEFSEEDIKNALSNFQGVKRRFTKTGESNGITIIDDYGHHPVEISATLKTAKDIVANRKQGKVIAVFQPHRYSRLNSLIEEFTNCFGDADKVIITDIYAAGEQPIKNLTKEFITQKINALIPNKAVALESRESLASTIAEIAESSDMVVCLGAGNISAWANALPQELDELYAQSNNAKKIA